MDLTVNMNTALDIDRDRHQKLLPQRTRGRFATEILGDIEVLDGHVTATAIDDRDGSSTASCPRQAIVVLEGHVIG